MQYRTEKDSLGEVKVPADKYWAAQTQRSLENFQIGTEKMPLEVIYAYAHLKKAAARTNAELNVLDRDKAELIASVCDEILEGKLDDQFPLSVWQTGSGTQTNMNVNEVIANRGHVLAGGSLEDTEKQLHPNDDINKSQSSNDTFPTAMHIAAYRQVQKVTLPGLKELEETLWQKSSEFKNIVKIGRTHFMDATPLTLGQEFSGYASQLASAAKSIQEQSKELLSLALGGTAVGTGLNAPEGYDQKVAEHIADQTKFPFKTAANKFESLAGHDAVVSLSGAFKRTAAALMKIGNDIRMLSSGPRCGIGEIIIPANEPGSSIMPGKVNPTQPEALTMVATQVTGCDAAITQGGMNGHFELNVFKPSMIFNILQAGRLIGDACRNFNDKCAKDIRPNRERIEEHLTNSLMLVTALNPHIGYDNAAAIAKKAYQENKTLKQAALDSGLVKEEDFDEWVDPEKMISSK